MNPESDLKDTPWEHDSGYTGSTKPKNVRFPISFKASIFFFILSLVVLIPIINAYNNPRDSSASAGQFWLTLFLGIYITLPASILSLICGLFALQYTKISLITVIPSTLFLGYLLIKVA